MRRPPSPYRLPSPSRRSPHHRGAPRPRRLALLPIAVVVTTGLSGCSLASFASMSPRLPVLLAPSSTASPSPSTAPLRKPGNLDTGSAERVLDAAGLHLVLDYWTTQEAATWGPASQGQVQLSATVRGTADQRLVKVTRLAVVGPPTSQHGGNVVLLDDRGEFVVGSPFTYQTAFQLPVYPPSTSGVWLTVTVDLLVETAPRAGTYSRITQQDRLYLSTTPRVDTATGGHGSTSPTKAPVVTTTRTP